MCSNETCSLGSTIKKPALDALSIKKFDGSPIRLVGCVRVNGHQKDMFDTSIPISVSAIGGAD